MKNRDDSWRMQIEDAELSRLRAQAKTNRQPAGKILKFSGFEESLWFLLGGCSKLGFLARI